MQLRSYATLPSHPTPSKKSVMQKQSNIESSELHRNPKPTESSRKTWKPDVKVVDILKTKMYVLWKI